jgi:hypothetical protein
MMALLEAPSMKAYLLTSGSIFGIIGTLHLSNIVLRWSQMTADGQFAAENLILTSIAGGLAFWAFTLVRSR